MELHTDILRLCLQLFTWKMQTLTREQYKQCTMQTISPAKVYSLFIPNFPLFVTVTS